MTTNERAVSGLLNALVAISRADNIHFAHGMAEQALKNIEPYLVRNSDGYRVLRTDDASEDLCDN